MKQAEDSSALPSDIVDQATRSRMMSGIRGKNTKPEIMIRKGLHAAGFRYRLHDRKLPGHPDIVLPRWNAVVFTHGCFWHGHDCHLFKWPKSRPDFWRVKINGNVARDKVAVAQLEIQGWRIATIWECALKGRTKPDFADVMLRLIAWIKSEEQTLEIRGE
ncbi:MAG: very short patch repair endonuclease [Asticcacaulis sp.]|uniref:very short patch repair endonuclease n=1 Tax=Asticcacaulis sp. TaxID=1872648 RepID=UPI003F7C8FB2